VKTRKARRVKGVETRRALIDGGPNGISPIPHGPPLTGGENPIPVLPNYQPLDYPPQHEIVRLRADLWNPFLVEFLFPLGIHNIVARADAAD
jgi:hypothetical protein